MPERQYVWFGGNGVDSDGDGYIGDNPATPAIVEGAGEKEIPWCFEYGEKEWKAGGTIMGDDGKMREKVFSDYRDIAEFDEGQQVVCQ